MMRGDSVGGDSHSMVLGALKSRYSCLSEPLPPATAGGLDNDRRYMHPLWVFGSRDDEPHSPPAARTTQRNRKNSERTISLEEIERHIGKPINVAAASLNVSRSVLRRCCRNLGIRWPKRKYNDKSNKTIRKRKRTESSVGLKKINKKHYGRKTTKELLDILVVVVSRLVKRSRKRRGILRRPYRNGPDKSDSRRKLGQAEIHTSEEASTSVFGERLCTKNPLCPKKQEQTEQHNENTAETNTVKILTIEATYGEAIAKFGFRISHGLVKLEELVATMFQLDFGSFKLKYVDPDGDLIWIACDIDLTQSVDDFRQMDHQTVIRLLVLPDEACCSS